MTTVREAAAVRQPSSPSPISQPVPDQSVPDQPVPDQSVPDQLAGAEPGGCCWPQAQAERGLLVQRAHRLPVGSQRHDKPAQRCLGVGRLLGWLDTFPGRCWQERWEATGSQELGPAWTVEPVRFIETTAPGSRPVSADQARKSVVAGMHALLCMGVLRPSYQWLRAVRFTTALGHVRELTDPGFFNAAAAGLRQAGHRERLVLDALNHLSRVVLHAGRGPRQLTPADLLGYHTALLDLGHQATAVGLAWDILSEAGAFPSDTGRLRDARVRGPRSVAELVDAHRLSCRPVRDVLVRYLSERATSVDYSSLRSLVRDLAGSFWKDLETHHPGIDSIRLAPDVAEGWKRRAGDRTRANPYKVLFTVRAFYLDMAQWALEDPSWVQWAVPSPVRAADVRGLGKHMSRRTARMHQRTRLQAPMLPRLVSSVDKRLRHLEQLVLAASTAAVGQPFTVDGQRFERIQLNADRRCGGQAGAGRLRVRRTGDGTTLDLTTEEEDAFWAWAIVETLRHTGIRLEEMLELTHLALVTHTLPDTGEAVPLLQIAPSKQDTERLLLVSPELAHVLARVVHRVRAGAEQVPLVARYDHYECTVGPRLPHLFQRRFPTERRVIGTTVVHRLLRLAVGHADLRGPDGLPLHYTPHDFRRIFATEAVSSGLPVHIAAKLLGHQNLNTTQGYVAVYNDDVLRHHSAFITRRRSERPSEEYRQPTDAEWAEFEGHFARRKVELGTCARPYGTPCRHEHACLRCPMLRPDPAQAQRLIEIIANLNERAEEAQQRGWLGELDGLHTSLTAARQKLRQMRQTRQTQADPVRLNPPTTRPTDPRR